MSVQIDEISAEIEPPRTEQAPAASPRPSEPSPQAGLRQQCELLTRLDVRAQRVCAD
ncbi:MAG: hypothetical protein ACREH8_00850 [Opitutaceae bacterium]